MTYMNIQQTAKYLNKSRHTLYKDVKLRKIPFVKTGRKLFFIKECLDEFMLKKQFVPEIKKGKE